MGAALGKDPLDREVHGALARMTGEGFALEKTRRPASRQLLPPRTVSLLDRSGKGFPVLGRS